MSKTTYHDLLKETIEYSLALDSNLLAKIAGAFFLQDLEDGKLEVIDQIFENHGYDMMIAIARAVYTGRYLDQDASLNVIRGTLTKFYWDQIQEKMQEYSESWKHKVKTQNPNHEYNPNEDGA